MNARVLLRVRTREFGAPGDGERHVGVGSTSAELGTLEAATVVDRDGEDSASRVDRSSGQHLLEVCRGAQISRKIRDNGLGKERTEREGVGRVHHCAD